MIVVTKNPTTIRRKVEGSDKTVPSNTALRVNEVDGDSINLGEDDWHPLDEFTVVTVEFVQSLLGTTIS